MKFLALFSHLIPKISIFLPRNSVPSVHVFFEAKNWFIRNRNIVNQDQGSLSHPYPKESSVGIKSIKWLGSKIINMEWFLYAFISFTFQGWIRYQSFCSKRTPGALVKTMKYLKFRIILVIPVCNFTLPYLLPYLTLPHINLHLTLPYV